eukprot:TRINITY_DN5737_c0_g1_i2.p1 TRINITY_DN5737_c0_g1~~TRINITY_DN5737_c0_g1_i2.p1  ORF type:complete len:146 (-),score=40.90 TRINITY_DN5737_c0_g1_i2:693-1130(-)
MMLTLCQCAGVVLLAQVGFYLLQVAWARLVYRFDWSPYRGEWGVVTGASDGLGKAYAMELARRKVNVVLIARRQQVLEEVAKSVREAHGVQTRCIAADFASADLNELYNGIKEKLADIAPHVLVLVNNVGGEFGQYHVNAWRHRH